ncbi:MAG: glycosyltransferase, partial [Candidatus Omnitrophica bacterium]|nr:glycosyltransferase [Candidatus Omnitrophota bacterium]
MQKIKIAQIITRLDWGGSADIIRILCESLPADKYEIKLIIGKTLHPADKTKSFLKKFKDNVIVVPWLKREISPLFDFLALFNLYLILIKEKFDIVHTHTAKAGALGRLAAHLAGNRKLIHMPHGNNCYGYFNFVVTRMVVWIERFLSKYTT